ncbi:carbohydrate binding domain-containing protein [Hymenobacter sp. BRD67]|uniref:carbohydrate binding domain-containing protein n=1 Tax=Hymenobacter sp. BRD67 TaxID=2675877 RepID=UPI0015646C02|nr:carbohydrate binding domain-containing protein [Hymenobacter sp. BRD67]QKG53972.1 hypothetical protein GKZ67_16900 [Hymenobacter sp. BRD67]
MKNWLALLLLASLASCGDSTSTPANSLASNNFESVDGWMGDTPQPSLTKEKAHSGAYSVSVRPGIDYSLGYNNTLGRMSTSRPEKIKISGWVYLPSPQASAQLVTEIKDPTLPTNNVLLWNGIDLKKEVKKFNEWQQVERVITIPATAKATSTLKVYLWRADDSQPVYLDDLSLSLDNEAK